MPSCATPVIHGCCFRCVMCVKHVSATHTFTLYFYTCNTCIGSFSMFPCIFYADLSFMLDFYLLNRMCLSLSGCIMVVNI